MDNEEVREEVDDARDDVEGEVEEERARIDEVTHDDDTRILDAIASLTEKLDGIRDMVSAFFESGATVSESLDVLDNDDDVAIVYDDDVNDDIDTSVIEDLSNIKFGDEYDEE